MSIVASETPSTAVLDPATGRSGEILRLRMALGIGAAVAVFAGSLVGDPAAALRADPALGHLLRGMAVIKGALALGAIAALWWRFGRPIEVGLARAYSWSAWFMAGAAMVVWQLAHVGVGALAFHGGELTLLTLAWFEHRAEVQRRPVGTSAARVR